MLISVIGATLAGCLVAIGKDKREDKIYRIEEVEILLDKDNICYVDLANDSSSVEKFLKSSS